MLKISHLCKQYKARKGQVINALDDVSLDLRAGMFGLLGPNGAGKSSLMRTLATLQTPDSGGIRLNGEDILAKPQLMRARLGYLPQEFGVYSGVSAYDLMDYLGKLKGMKNSVARHREILFLLEQVNLLEHKDQAVSRFSGGMKQRFGIAQALLNQPEVLIVDEPTAGLDPEERNRFHNLLVSLSENKIVLLSTHIVEDVKNLCPNMAILHSGKVLQQGTPTDIIEGVRGRVWQLECSPQELAQLSGNFDVISQHLYAGKLTVRVLSEEQPTADFTAVSVELEDAYFASLKRAVLISTHNGQTA